jgi:hypothetical protein
MCVPELKNIDTMETAGMGAEIRFDPMVKQV